MIRDSGPCPSLMMVISIILALLSAGAAWGEPLSRPQQLAVLDEAQHAYDRGISMLHSNPAQAGEAFRSAADRYQLVIDSGVTNGLLYYNLANAQVQLGDLGHAILNYQRAEQLIPGDARLEANLQFARSLCQSRIEAGGGQALLDALLLWHTRVATRTRAALFAVAYLLFWAALALRLLRWARPWTAFIIGLGVVGFALAASVGADVVGCGHRPAGVITADEAIVRKGNGAGYAPQFEQPLHAGAEFELLESRGDWLEIRMPNGGTGWIEAHAAELVGTPAP